MSKRRRPQHPPSPRSQIIDGFHLIVFGGLCFFHLGNGLSYETLLDLLVIQLAVFGVCRAVWADGLPHRAQRQRRQGWQLFFLGTALSLDRWQVLPIQASWPSLLIALGLIIVVDSIVRRQQKEVTS